MVMKVLCRFNNLGQIKDKNSSERIRKYILMPDGEMGLEVGQEYVVYGILFRDNSPWLYLCEEGEDYPTPYPLEQFKITDKTFPSEWELSFQHVNGTNRTEIVFPEWANASSFYENLVDGSENEVEIFNKYKKEYEIS